MLTQPRDLPVGDGAALRTVPKRPSGSPLSSSAPSSGPVLSLGLSQDRPSPRLTGPPVSGHLPWWAPPGATTNLRSSGQQDLADRPGAGQGPGPPQRPPSLSTRRGRFWANLVPLPVSPTSPVLRRPRLHGLGAQLALPGGHAAGEGPANSTRDPVQRRGASGQGTARHTCPSSPALACRPLRLAL